MSYHLNNNSYKDTNDLPRCYDGKPVKLKDDDKKDRSPHCPYCYDGEIVQDNFIEGLFFCNRCFRKVKILKYNEVIE